MTVRRSGIAWSIGAAGPVLAAVDEPRDWRDLALCAEIGDDLLWFPVRGGSMKDAKAICSMCPSQEPCLEYALTASTPSGAAVSGIWGGTSEGERRRIRHERAEIRDAA